jgi:hypothetical protein
MKAILLIKPRKGKPHGAVEISALGFAPCHTPSGLWYALEVFPRKIDAVLRMHDIALANGVPCRMNAPLIWVNDVRIELHSGHKAQKVMDSFAMFHPFPLITGTNRSSQKVMKARAGILNSHTNQKAK